MLTRRLKSCRIAGFLARSRRSSTSSSPSQSVFSSCETLYIHPKMQLVPLERRCSIEEGRQGAERVGRRKHRHAPKALKSMLPPSLNLPLSLQIAPHISHHISPPFLWFYYLGYFHFSRIKTYSHWLARCWRVLRAMKKIRRQSFFPAVFF